MFTTQTVEKQLEQMSSLLSTILEKQEGSNLTQEQQDSLSRATLLCKNILATQLYDEAPKPSSILRAWLSCDNNPKIVFKVAELLSQIDVACGGKCPNLRVYDEDPETNLVLSLLHLRLAKLEGSSESIQKIDQRIETANIATKNALTGTVATFYLNYRRFREVEREHRHPKMSLEVKQLEAWFLKKYIAHLTTKLNSHGSQDTRLMLGSAIAHLSRWEKEGALNRDAHLEQIVRCKNDLKALVSNDLVFLCALEKELWEKKRSWSAPLVNAWIQWSYYGEEYKESKLNCFFYKYLACTLELKFYEMDKTEYYDSCKEQFIKDSGANPEQLARAESSFEKSVGFLISVLQAVSDDQSPPYTTRKFDSYSQSFHYLRTTIIPNIIQTTPTNQDSNQLMQQIRNLDPTYADNLFSWLNKFLDWRDVAIRALYSGDLPPSLPEDQLISKRNELLNKKWSFEGNHFEKSVQEILTSDDERLAQLLDGT
jgi:hypothetical protein